MNWDERYQEILVRYGLAEGGPGSGYFGHAGRPGEIGGSSAGSPLDISLFGDDEAGQLAAKRWGYLENELAKPLGELKGSEKQIAWASTIRDKTVVAIRQERNAMAQETRDGAEITDSVPFRDVAQAMNAARKITNAS